MRIEKPLFKKLFAVGIYALLIFAAFSAYAQVLSGRGVNDGARREVDCLADVTRIETLIFNLENFYDELVQCNSRGQVYSQNANGGNGGCVDLDPLRAEWRNSPGDPTGLAFETAEGIQVGAEITVRQGNDGLPASCPTGYEKVGG